MSKTKRNISTRLTGKKKILKELAKKAGKWAIILGAIGSIFKVGCVYMEHKKNLEHFRVENEMQARQQKEVFELREKIYNLEQDLRDCEIERKQHGKRETKISKGDK